MARLTRRDPLPDAMQGRWVDADDPLAELIVEGGEITCFGRKVDYDYKQVELKDGALVVALGVDDPAMEGNFARANIIGLAISPEGDFHGWNVKLGCQFVRRAG